MSQPVKLSDGLVFDARMAGSAVQRSIAGQVDYWARLGRAVDLLLEGRQAIALSRGAATASLSSHIASVDSEEGRRRVRDFLATQPYPHYEPLEDHPGLLVRIEADGTRTTGRFVNRRFRKVRPRRKAGR